MQWILSRHAITRIHADNIVDIKVTLINSAFSSQHHSAIFTLKDQIRVAKMFFRTGRVITCVLI